MNKDKLISIRVNNVLLENFKIIISENVEKSGRRYVNTLSRKYCDSYSNYTISDLLEFALRNFIEDNQ